jgi:hypothetical protein
MKYSFWGDVFAVICFGASIVLGWFIVALF